MGVSISDNRCVRGEYKPRRAGWAGGRVGMWVGVGIPLVALKIPTYAFHVSRYIDSIFNRASQELMKPISMAFQRAPFSICRMCKVQT